MLILLVAFMSVISWLPNPLGWYMPVQDSCVEHSLLEMLTPGWSAFTCNILLPALLLFALLKLFPKIAEALEPTRSQKNSFSALAVMLCIDWTLKFSPTTDALLSVLMSGTSYVLLIFILGLRLVAAYSIVRILMRAARRESNPEKTLYTEGGEVAAIVLVALLAASGIYWIASGKAGNFAFSTASPASFSNQCFDFATARAQGREDVPTPRFRR